MGILFDRVCDYVHVMYFQKCYFYNVGNLVLSWGICWLCTHRMDVSRGYGWW